MRFYTNVQMVGDHFLVRGYENGRHFATREKFYPTLFVPSNKKTKYKTLEGDYVESIEPGTVRDCREFIKKYDGVENFKIYGNERRRGSSYYGAGLYYQTDSYLGSRTFQ